MAGASREKCSAIARSGSRCRSAVLPGRPYCFLHDPLAEPARREGARKGGPARSNAERAKRAMPTAMTGDELAGRLSVLFTQVVAGKVEPRVGTAAATIAKVLFEVWTAVAVEDLQAQVDALTALIGRERAA